MVLMSTGMLERTVRSRFAPDNAGGVYFSGITGEDPRVIRPEDILIDVRCALGKLR
jgi:hypothetical protein